MKRKMAAVLACVLAVSSMAACGDNSNNATNTTDASNTTVSTEIAEATITPTVEIVETAEGTALSAVPVEDYVVLGNYKNMQISVAKKQTYTDEEFNELIKDSFAGDLSYASTDIFEVSGVVAEDDYVLINYVGKQDDVAFDGGSAQDTILRIGSGQFIDGFEEGLIGVNVGDTVDLELTFPEEYPNNPDLAGVDVVFTVTVQGMLQFNDDAVAALGYEGIDTVEAYKSAMKSIVESDAESTYTNAVTTAICEKLLEDSIVTKVPSTIYNEEKEYIINEVQSEASQYGVDADTYTLAFIGVNLADYAVTVAEEYAKQAVIFQAIANAEELNPSDEDADAYVDDFISIYGEAYGISGRDDFYEVYTKEDIKQILMQENVVNFIKDTATITETE